MFLTLHAQTDGPVKMKFGMDIADTLDNKWTFTWPRQNEGFVIVLSFLFVITALISNVQTRENASSLVTKKNSSETEFC